MWSFMSFLVNFWLGLGNPRHIATKSQHLWTVPRQIRFWSILKKSWDWVRPPPPSLGQNPNFYQKFVLEASLSWTQKFWKTQIPSGTVASGRNPTRRTCFGRLGTSFRHSSWDKQGINIPFVGTVETITCWTRHTTTRPPGSSSKFTKKVYACPVSIQLDYVFSLNEGTIFTLMNLKPFQLWHLGEDLRQCCLTLQPQVLKSASHLSTLKHHNRSLLWTKLARKARFNNWLSMMNFPLKIVSQDPFSI